MSKGKDPVLDKALADLRKGLRPGEDPFYYDINNLPADTSHSGHPAVSPVDRARPRLLSFMRREAENETEDPSDGSQGGRLVLFFRQHGHKMAYIIAALLLGCAVGFLLKTFAGAKPEEVREAPKPEGPATTGTMVAPAPMMPPSSPRVLEPAFVGSLPEPHAAQPPRQSAPTPTSIAPRVKKGHAGSPQRTDLATAAPPSSSDPPSSPAPPAPTPPEEDPVLLLHMPKKP